uniref:Uncharacterized protein n=1 Tax=Arundo donax TaxID=35708 RepID=A0A0A9BU96_ARUDO
MFRKGATKEITKGIAYPGCVFHYQPILDDYARVQMSWIDSNYAPLELYHSTLEGIEVLGEAVNQFILCNEREIILTSMPPPLLAPSSQVATSPSDPNPSLAHSLKGHANPPPRNSPKGQADPPPTPPPDSPKSMGQPTTSPQASLPKGPPHPPALPQGLYLRNLHPGGLRPLQLRLRNLRQRGLYSY